MFRYRIAEHGSPDLESWHRLRTAVYLETGLITPSDIGGEGVYQDRYAEHAIHILGANDDGVDIGCWRMIEPAEGRTLPVTDLFGVDVVPMAYESSAMAIRPEYRTSIAGLGFQRATYAIAEEKGYEYVYGIVEEPVLDSMRRLGYPLRVIGEPRHVFHATNVAIIVERSEILPSLQAADATRPGAEIAHLWDRPFGWTLSVEDLAPGS